MRNLHLSWSTYIWNNFFYNKFVGQIFEQGSEYLESS